DDDKGHPESMLRINGRVFREEGMLVAELSEIAQTTWAHSFDEILGDIPRLVVEYIAAAQQAGVLGRELARFGASPRGGQLDVHVHVLLEADPLPAQPPGTQSSLDTQLSVPLAA